MYMRCKAMKWNFLPNAGGIYDQDPVLLAGFDVLMHEEAEVARKEQEKRKREAERNKGRGGGGRVAGRRGR